MTSGQAGHPGGQLTLGDAEKNLLKVVKLLLIVGTNGALQRAVTFQLDARVQAVSVDLELTFGLCKSNDHYTRAW